MTEELDVIMREPLNAFDYFIKLLWEYADNPSVAVSIKMHRDQIAALNNPLQQYQAVLQYVARVTHLKRDAEQHPEKIDYFLKTFCPHPLNTRLL